MPFAYGGVLPWGFAVLEATAGVMALIWILKMLRAAKFEFIRTPITLLIFLFIVYVLVQLFSHSLPFTTFYFNATKTELLKVVSYALIFFVTLNTIKTRRQITRILSVIIGTGFIMSVLYLFRYFGANVPRGFINRDHFSAYLNMIIPLTLGVLFAGTSQDSKNEAVRIPSTYSFYSLKVLLLFSITVMAAALFLTMSRGGMFTFIAALLLMTVLALRRRTLRKHRWIIWAVMIFIVSTIAWLGATPVIERILSIKVEITSLYFSGRMPIWQGTVHLIRDYWTFGSGLGTFQYVFPKYQPPEIARFITNAHSDILEFLSEVGVVGFLMLAVLCLVLFIYTLRRYFVRHNVWVSSLSIGFLGALTTIFLHSFTDFSLHMPANAVLLTIIISLFVMTLNIESDRKPGQLLIPVYRASISQRVRLFLYPLALFITGLFICVCVRPAVADYYFRKFNAAESENYELQTACLQKSLGIEPLNAEYHYQLGKLYFNKSVQAANNAARTAHLLSSIGYLSSSTRLNPGNSKYHQSLAWSCGRLADLYERGPQAVSGAVKYKQQAVKEFETAISAEPNNPYRYRTYALWLFNHPAKENMAKAVEQYKKAVELNPGLAKEALEQYAKHQQAYEQLINILPGTKESDHEIFRFIKKNEGMEFAMDFAEDFLETYSHNAGIHFDIAHDSLYAGYPWDFSEGHYTIVFASAPDKGSYRLYHGVHLSFKHYYREALKELETASAMNLCPVDEQIAKEYIVKCKKALTDRE